MGCVGDGNQVIETFIISSHIKSHHTAVRGGSIKCKNRLNRKFVANYHIWKFQIHWHKRQQGQCVCGRACTFVDLYQSIDQISQSVCSDLYVIKHYANVRANMLRDLWKCVFMYVWKLLDSPSMLHNSNSYPSGIFSLVILCAHSSNETELIIVRYRVLRKLTKSWSVRSRTLSPPCPSPCPPFSSSSPEGLNQIYAIYWIF